MKSKIRGRKSEVGSRSFVTFVIFCVSLWVCGAAQGQNVMVVNPTTRPVPVNIVAGSGAAGTGTVVSSGALEASHVLKNSAGTLVSIVGYNSKTSAQFIQLFNSTTVPSEATVPIVTFIVSATSNFSYDVPSTGLPFATGISVSNSSTAATKTIGSADCFFAAVVK